MGRWRPLTFLWSFEVLVPLPPRSVLAVDIVWAERTRSEGNDRPSSNVKCRPSSFFRSAERRCDLPSTGFTDTAFPRCVSAAGGVQTETHLHECWCKTNEPTSRCWSSAARASNQPKKSLHRFSAEPEGSHLPARAAAHFWGIFCVSVKLLNFWSSLGRIMKTIMHQIPVFHNERSVSVYILTFPEVQRYAEQRPVHRRIKLLCRDVRVKQRGN